MRFKFASWNLNRRRPKDVHLELLHSLNVDILALQEVSRPLYYLLDSDKMFAWSAFSLDISNPRPDGCALFGTSLFKLISKRTMNNAPFPEQTIICQLESSAGAFNACSFHIPNGSSHGVGHGDKKRVSGRIIAEWLTEQRIRTVFGIDANSPKVDHPDIAKCELYGSDEPELLGLRPNPIHNLTDALRIYIESNLEIKRTIERQRPNGPLAVSYNRGNNLTKVDRRYDHIYVTPDIKVINIKYLDLVAEASDHALVIAELDAHLLER